MAQKMTVLGVGEKLAFIAFPYLAIVIYIHYKMVPLFNISKETSQNLVIIGSALIIFGLILNFTAAFSMLRAFKRNELVTNGLYTIFKNPMYASFILFTIPGISLLLNSNLIWTASIVLYIALRIFIKGEEEYLAKQFGEAYQTYCKKVWVKLL